MFPGNVIYRKTENVLHLLMWFAYPCSGEKGLVQYIYTASINVYLIMFLKYAVYQIPLYNYPHSSF